MNCPGCRNVLEEDKVFLTIYYCNESSCSVDSIIVYDKPLGAQIDKAYRKYQWENKALTQCLIGKDILTG